MRDPQSATGSFLIWFFPHLRQFDRRTEGSWLKLFSTLTIFVL
jgi:hypothetical protein